MDGASPGPGGPGAPKAPPRKRIDPIWWVVLILLMLWNLWSFRPAQSSEVNISYSGFLDQVRQGAVARVKIVGDHITGSFAHPVQWPPAAQAGTPASPASPPASPAPGGAAAKTPPPSYKTFATTFPADVGDPSLLPLLEAKNVTVDVNSPSPPWFTVLLTDGLPILLLVGMMVWIARSAGKAQAGIFRFGRTSARSYTDPSSRVTFNDVAGADEAKADLMEVVDFLKQPQKYHLIGARIPRGVLLVGPPGTGKTLMARAVAGEAGVPFFHLSGSEFVEMFVGVGASRVRDLFTQAKSSAPAIVFIDELDAVGRRRGAGLGAVNDEREQTLNQLLVEMDGFDERQEVIILAATNRPDVLDPALLRPGRFDRQVTVPLPDRTAREGILKIHTRRVRLEPEVDLAVVARTASGLSGADLANLCNEAALIAARQDHTQVSMKDFDEAWDKILLGGARPGLLDPAARRVVAYHEGGHALVAWLTPAADPVRRVTIIPRGRALGVTEQVSGEDRYNYSRPELVARLDVMLGGRVAEQLAIGQVSTGAESDLVQATRLVRRMVTRWGMGSLGPVAFSADEEQPFLGYQLAQGRDYSEATAAQIDRDLEHLLAEREEAVRGLLSSARAHLDRLAEILLAEETVGQEALQQLLGPRPAPAPPSPEGPQPISEPRPVPTAA